MNICVIGTGYVGLVTGVCLAQSGHSVICIDNNIEKVRLLKSGSIPIYEPGLQENYHNAVSNKKLQVTESLEVGVRKADVIFLALPTPPLQDGSADVSAVLAVADQLGPLLSSYTVIVNKSTVPIGTGEQVTERLAASTKASFDVVSNPEFLREGFAVQDFLHPDRVVIGTLSAKARDVMQAVYEPIVSDSEQFIWMDVRSAEMTKYAANAFLAMKVTFMNEIANLSEKIGANVDAVRLGIGPDTRIGNRFLYAGIGYGGSCFPKDVRALQHTAKSYNYDFKLLNGVISANALQKQRLVDKVYTYFNKDLKGKQLALWGLAFKPETDDIREAPALEIIKSLLHLGANIVAYDPHAIKTTQTYFGTQNGLSYAKNAQEALKNADALLVATEWKEFVDCDLEIIKNSMKSPVIFDGRNIFDPLRAANLGFHYDSIGRPLQTVKALDSL